ncbi:MAG TPA: ATP-dependent 6-phosphofructokinase [Rhizomicrobium sp.]
MTIRRIAILTGGGDVPGLNPCIKAVTRRAGELGWDVVGFRRGYAGLLHYNPDDPEGSAAQLMALNRESVRTIDRTGGTVLHSSRTSPDKMRDADLPDFLRGRFAPDAEGYADCTPHILRVLEALEIDALVTLGGDGTLSYSARLMREGVRLISVPKTMDNDVFGTDYCIGFSTAVSRSVEFISALRTTAGSHERIAVIELFGRNSGETALITGYLADVDRVLIAEVPFDVARVGELLVADRADNPASYAMLVVSEGARLEHAQALERAPRDAHGTQRLGGIGELVGAEINRLTGVGTIVQNLGYLMRAGAPDALDLMVAKSYGAMAVQLLSEGRHGLMTAIQDGCYEAVAGDTCLKGKRRVDTGSFYDRDAYRPRIRGVPGKPMFLY